MAVYANLNNVRLRCDVGIGDAFLFIVLWMLISIFTFGIGAIFSLYYFYNLFIDKTHILDQNGDEVATLECQLKLTEIIGHIVIWLIIGIVTFGIGFLFFTFMIFKMCVNNTVVVPRLVRDP
jgi:hypothetical protein